MKSHSITSFIALFALVAIVKQESFSAFNSEMQEKVKAIANNMTNIFASRCSKIDYINCRKKSYNNCYTVSQPQCVIELPTALGCTLPGSFISLQSSIRFPNSANLSNLTENESMFTCISAYLSDILKKIYQESNSRYTLSYFGSANGGFRLHPSFVSPKINETFCYDYDPRLRPWYASGSSGAKNLIILVPTTGRVSSQGNFELVKKTANVIVKTLSNYDFFNIVTYSETASTLDLNYLVRATQSNKQLFLKLIQEINISGGYSNYEVAFKKVFETLSQPLLQNTSLCQDAQNIILMLTNSQPQVGKGSSSSTYFELKSHIDNLKANTGKQIILFTYGLPTSQTLTTPLSLSCDYNGIYFEVTRNNGQDDSLLTTSIAQYYTYIAQGIQNSSPIWSSPYTDAFGLGRLVTISYPSFTSLNNIRTLYGVAGIDVRVQYLLQKLGFNSEKQLQAQLLSSNRCSNTSKFSSDSCLLQQLRPANSKCPSITVCPVTDTYLGCIISTNNIFHESQFTTFDICCPASESNIAMIIGAVVGVILLFVIAIIAVIIYRRWRSSINKDQKYKDNKKYGHDPEIPIPGKETDSKANFQIQKPNDIQRDIILKRAEGPNDIKESTIVSHNPRQVIIPGDGQNLNQMQKKQFLKNKEASLMKQYKPEI